MLNTNQYKLRCSVPIVTKKIIAVQPRRCQVTLQAVTQDVSAESIVKAIKEGLADGKLPPSKMCKAIAKLEKLKVVDPETMVEKLKASPCWQLRYISQPDQVKAQAKEGTGGGYYIPFPVAYQQYTQQTVASIIAIPYLFGLKFSGDFSTSKNKLEFTFTQALVKLGPLSFNPTMSDDMSGASQKVKPFFLKIYIDDEILVSRGKGGGYAAFTRVPQQNLISQGLGSLVP